jgi:hypothetical protein
MLLTERGRESPVFQGGDESLARPLTNICSSAYANQRWEGGDVLPYKQANTQCVVRLVSLRGLPQAALAHCQALRAEAGRLWTDLAHLHADARATGTWLSAADLEQATKGGQYALHSQSVQALCQKFLANVATAVELRKQELAETERIQTEYPHHPKVYQTVAARAVRPLSHREGGTAGRHCRVD